MCISQELDQEQTILDLTQEIEFGMLGVQEAAWPDALQLCRLKPPEDRQDAGQGKTE